MEGQGGDRLVKTSTSVVIESPGVLSIREFPVPEIGPEDLLLKVEMVSVCGTDPALYSGKIPTTPYPIMPGHEVVGYVEDLGEKAALTYGIEKGDRVTVEPYILCRRCRYCLTGSYQLCVHKDCYGFTISSARPQHLWGAYGDYLYVAPGSKLHKVHPGVPPEAACLSSVVGNGIRWVRTRGGLRLGEDVVIIGPGAQGLCAVAAASQAGADHIIVLGMNRDLQRLALAREFGATHTISVEEEDPLEAVRRITGGTMVDLAIECTGSAAAIQTGFKLVKPLGRFVLVGLAGGKEIGIVTDRLVMNEITVLGGLGQSWDVEDAMKLINTGKIPFHKMITHVFPVREAETALKMGLGPPDDVIKMALRP